MEARGVEMQQQPPQMVNISPSFPPTAITTEQIQKVLFSATFRGSFFLFESVICLFCWKPWGK